MMFHSSHSSPTKESEKESIIAIIIICVDIIKFIV